MYLGRYRRVARLLDAGESRALKIPQTHNYSGFKGIAGPVLLARLREQARSYGTPPETGRVRSLIRENDFFAAVVDGELIKSKTILLATGLVDVSPEVGGKLEASDEVIRYCPICDGYEAIDRKVGVLGSLQDAGKKALFLRTYTRDVTLFVTGGDGSVEMRDELLKAGITIFSTKAPPEIRGSDRVAVNVGDGKWQDVEVLYPALGCTPRSEFAVVLGAERDNVGCLKVDAHQQTTVDGLYAAGDVVTDLHQLSVAIGHAAIAATAVHNGLPSNPR
jgi:thioredoxin reductase (NADPH)